MPSAGQRVRAVDFTSSVSDTQNTSGTTTSTSYTATLSGGTACSVTFVAPSSGRVEICNSVRANSSSSSISAHSVVVVRTGTTVGSGDVVINATDEDSVFMTGTSSFRLGVTRILSGLTPGSSYNAQQNFRVGSTGTATFASKHLSVKPVP